MEYSAELQTHPQERQQCAAIKRNLFLAVTLFLFVGASNVLFMELYEKNPWIQSLLDGNSSSSSSSSSTTSTSSSSNDNASDTNVLVAGGGDASSSSSLRGNVQPSTTTTTTTTTPSSGKPKFVIHVGPPKTGTTTLQTDLTEWAEYLQLDGYAYKGRQYHPEEGHHKDLIMHPFIPDFVYKIRNSCESLVRGAHDDVQRHLRDIKEEMEPYRLQNISVITSDEVYSKVLDRKACYANLQETLGEHWEIIVVANYRRIFEWVPSSKFQQERVKMGWPGPGPNGGESSDHWLGPLFPDVLNGDHFYRGYRFTDFVLDMVNNVMPVKVLNLYDGDLLSDFLCDVLQDAPQSCQASLDRQESNMNTRPPERGNELYYDALALEALNRGWVNRSAWERWTVKGMVHHHTVSVLNQTALDFPQICPSKEELEQLLNASLDIEAKVFPDVAAAWAPEHVEKFWKLVNTTTYCWIDVHQTLEDPAWQEFFMQFAT